mmetsp:Transcript_13591/g.42775  ORF Transcript_13591/g.42775 Transcript_13591/m.42775 type:complete len:375 (-) Transcript_13591:178-1302(-)
MQRQWRRTCPPTPGASTVRTTMPSPSKYSSFPPATLRTRSTKCWNDTVMRATATTQNRKRDTHTVFYSVFACRTDTSCPDSSSRSPVSVTCTASLPSSCHSMTVAPNEAGDETPRGPACTRIGVPGGKRDTPRRRSTSVDSVSSPNIRCSSAAQKWVSSWSRNEATPSRAAMSGSRAAREAGSTVMSGVRCTVPTLQPRPTVTRSASQSTRKPATLPIDCTYTSFGHLTARRLAAAGSTARTAERSASGAAATARAANVSTCPCTGSHEAASTAGKMEIDVAIGLAEPVVQSRPRRPRPTRCASAETAAAAGPAGLDLLHSLAALYTTSCVDEHSATWAKTNGIVTTAEGGVGGRESATFSAGLSACVRTVGTR